MGSFTWPGKVNTLEQMEKNVNTMHSQGPSFSACFHVLDQIKREGLLRIHLWCVHPREGTHQF